VPKFLESFQFIWILGAETLIKSIWLYESF
jgi:hypothetical protein